MKTFLIHTRYFDFHLSAPNLNSAIELSLLTRNLTLHEIIYIIEIPLSQSRYFLDY